MDLSWIMAEICLTNHLSDNSTDPEWLRIKQFEPNTKTLEEKLKRAENSGASGLIWHFALSLRWQRYLKSELKLLGALNLDRKRSIAAIRNLGWRYVPDDTLFFLTVPTIWTGWWESNWSNSVISMVHELCFPAGQQPIETRSGCQ